MVVLRVVETPAKGGKPPAVALSDVAIEYAVAGQPVYRAVAPTSLVVAESEFVAIIGPTGCGKSTLLNAAAGLLRPASGAVPVFGEPLFGLNGKAGYLFLQYALMPWQS